LSTPCLVGESNGKHEVLTENLNGVGYNFVEESKACHPKWENSPRFLTLNPQIRA